MAIKANKSKKIKAPSKFKGYKLIQKVSLDNIQSELLLMEHLKSGAKILHIANDDTNNLFNIFLPTYPQSSNGVAHILEHTTLCGSQKYPVRDAFFAMNKRSLNTFMNAMTGSDFTCYPASSTVEKDYFNLLNIYLDSVFFPRLRYTSFLQEGHRLEFEKPDDLKSPLTYKGVVFNEMKGAMSDPQRRLGQSVNEALFPTSMYGYNSGGEPSVIPDLTYDDLKKFHQKYYHPSNAIFFFYGNIALEKNLKMIEENVFKHFKKQTINIAIPEEKRFKKPLVLKSFYPSSTKLGEGVFCGYSWLTCDHHDPSDVIGLELFCSILTDYDHSPLKMALVNSGLAIDLVDGPVDIELNEIPVTFAAKGVKAANAKKVQKVILDVLMNINKNGLPNDLVEAAFHTIEVQTRERREPYGLHLSFLSLLSYTRGEDPSLLLIPDKVLGELRSKIEKGDYFKKLVQKWFLKNPHRVDFVVSPDMKFHDKEEAVLKKQLLNITKKLNQNQKLKIKADAELLLDEQSKGDDPASIARLPKVRVKDIPVKVQDYKLSLRKINQVPVYSHVAATNGITYAKLEFNISDFTLDEMSYLPILGNLLVSIGTKKKSFIELSSQISQHIGGLSIYPVCNNELTPKGGFSSYFCVSMNGLFRKNDKMLELLQEVLLESSFSNKEKILEVVTQTKSSFAERINPSGHQFAAMHAARFLSESSRLTSVWEGIEQLEFLEKIEKQIKVNDSKFIKTLEKLMSKIFTKKRMEIVIGSQDSNLKSLFKSLPAVVKNFPTGISVKKSVFKVKKSYVKDTYSISTNVAFNARIIPAVNYLHKDAAPLSVLARILGSGYMHTEVREKGGAYGGMANFNVVNGNFTFASYRDPNINKTFAAYDAAAKYILDNGISEESLEEGILQVFAGIDSPHSPGSIASIAHMQLKQKLTKEKRLKYRKQLLNVQVKDLLRVTKTYLLKPKKQSEAIVSSLEMFKKEKVKTK